MHKLFRINTIDRSLRLLRGQLRFLNQEFDVTAIANDSGALAEVAKREGVRTIGVPMRREINLAADCRSLVQLYKIFRCERPYIVHANTPKASLLSMVAAWAARVPHRIYTVTGLRFETTRGVLRFTLKMMERITCLCATKVIPEGDGVKATLLREHITRKPMEKIHNGNINGIDLEHYDRTEQVTARAAEIRNGSEEFTFIFIGRMVRDKGINELVAAFARLNRDIPATKLLLVGKFEDELDPILPETKRMIENNPNIEFVGYQNDVRPYLAAADVAVLPSYREGFPNVVMQAGAMAKRNELFVLDMGNPVKIVDLAENMIKLCGLEPNKDIDIKITGLRPGEKLYEERLMAEEGLQKTANEMISIGKPLEIDEENLFKKIQDLYVEAYNETDKMKELVHDLVPTYKIDYRT